MGAAFRTERIATGMNSSLKINTSKSITKRNEKTFKRGSLMFIEGEMSTEMYILRSGKVRVLKQEGSNTIELAVLGPGSVLGELSLLDRQPRGATVQVTDEVVATVVDESLFTRTLSAAPPWLTSIVKLVVKRLRDTMKRTGDDIVRKSVGGAIKVLLLLHANEGFQKDDMECVSVLRAKELIYAIMGLGALEAEQVFLHCILKDLILIRKNETGREYICLKNITALRLYMDFLRAQQRGIPLIGEKLSEKAVECLDFILTAGNNNGKKLQPPLFSIGQSQVEMELERAGKGRFIDRDALEELLAAKIIMLKENETETKYGAHTRTVIVYNADILSMIHLLSIWLPVFREDVTF
jgi:CRP/FNR family cyclic AMP-dependent transcriptional regulator